MIHVGDFRTRRCPKDAAVVIADPPYGLGKVYAGKRETADFAEHARALLEWSHAPWLFIFGPQTTMRDWLHQIPEPTRILWWCKTFAQIRSTTTWQHAVTPVLVYEAPGAEFHYRRGSVPDWIACCTSMADVRHLAGSKHPGVTGTQIATELILPTTRVGDLVVDPMCGTGSVLVAGQRLGRRVWGSEIEPSYAHIARDWLDRESRKKAA